MESYVGTVARGIRAPIIRQGDDLAQIVVDSVLLAAEKEHFSLEDKDVVGITEAVVARAQGNYATVDQIAQDIRSKFPNGEAGIIFPILSRNRFAMCLKGIARGLKKLTIQLSYPSDEVGNHLIDLDELDEKGINPYTDVLTEKKYRDLFGVRVHRFTGVDYVQYYGDLVRSEGTECEIIFANHPTAILNNTKQVLCCDIHSRNRSKRLLEKAGVDKVYLLTDIMSSSICGSGFNENYGLLGSNKATEESVKLFPRDCEAFVEAVKKGLSARSGKEIEVMVYGDGAFKDPVGGIWELADPVVSPAFSAGLNGTPNELKLKYLADNQFADLSGEDLRQAISQSIKEKDQQLKGKMETEGTTPRRYTDLLGSLCDLTSGSGDKGTPIVLIQRYFTNYTN